ncbi:hypothetical protein F7649_10600 [Tenacibaculum piscium]|uniref:hypothetical protein n=1 Tax=Tenacibaculum piscium TaxID=1458515 RepID=UPI00187BC347|nr:hypothetical protein [Tenacibaculum piscium]MBE7671561.1 hypothetical protein [Tenacibaculum piscium]
MNLSKEITLHLNKPNHAIIVSDNENRTIQRKGVAHNKKFFSLEDIQNLHGSVDEFLKYLQQKDFSETTFSFYRIYGNGAKKVGINDIIINLQEFSEKDEKDEKDEKSEFSENQNNQSIMKSPKKNKKEQQQQQNSNINFLAGNNMDNQNMQFLGAMVESQRAGDYKRQAEELREENKDNRSKIRRLEEENHKLKLKVETSEERAELKIQQKILEKQSIFESAGFQKVAESLGGLLPLLPSLLNKGAVPAQLGGDTNLSAMQNQAIEMIKVNNDKTASLVLYIAQNNSPELMELIENHINNKS